MSPATHLSADPASAYDGAEALAFDLRGILGVLKMAIETESGGLEPEQRACFETVIRDAAQLACDLTQELDRADTELRKRLA